MLDYQERPEAPYRAARIDRVTLDGKWSGNLYDFYRKVYLKLTADLKVPFALEKGQRQDETPVHEALREALANALVHADYADRASVLVVKRPDMFGFRPGADAHPGGGGPAGRRAGLPEPDPAQDVPICGGRRAGRHGHSEDCTVGWASIGIRRKLRTTAPVSPYNQTLLELRMVDFVCPR